MRLRSIGDTVLTTPSLIALRRFLPEAQIDILLEDWVAPVLEGFREVDNILTFSRKSKKSRVETLIKLRRAKYDVVFNLHGGTTSTFFVRAAGAKHRVGFSHYRYAFLYNHLLSSSIDFWHTEKIHSAEQHLALLGFAGVPVSDKPKSRLAVTEKALKSVEEKLNAKDFYSAVQQSAIRICSDSPDRRFRHETMGDGKFRARQRIFTRKRFGDNRDCDAERTGNFRKSQTKFARSDCDFR